MKLDRIIGFSRQRDCEQIVYNQLVKLAKINGVWYGLDWASCDPVRLRNTEARVLWGRAQGLDPKAVLAYCRKERKREKMECQQRNLAIHMAAVRAAGYTITNAKGDVV